MKPACKPLVCLTLSVMETFRNDPPFYVQTRCTCYITILLNNTDESNAFVINGDNTLLCNRRQNQRFIDGSRGTLAQSVERQARNPASRAVPLVNPQSARIFTGLLFTKQRMDSWPFQTKRSKVGGERNGNLPHCAMCLENWEILVTLGSKTVLVTLLYNE